MADKYPFIFNTSPSPKTIVTIYETLRVHRNQVASFTGPNDEFLKGYVDAYDTIIADLEKLEKDLHYKKGRG